MRKTIVTVIVVVVLAILAGAMFVLDGGRSRVKPREEGESAAVPPARAEGEPSSSPVVSPTPTKRARPEAVAEREAMRRRILESMRAREGAAAGDEHGSSGGDEPVPGASTKGPRAEGSGPDDAAPTPGNLIDRTGNRGYLTKVMNEDLMPLADECYELARQTDPRLAGMLVLNFELIGDEEIGGVIESVALGQGNELVHPELVECMQESILSTTLPPPPPEQGGRDAISLSLRFEPDEE